MQPPKFIRIPLFKLYHINNVDSFTGLSANEWKEATKAYTEEELEGIKDAIEWAVNNKGFDFSSLLPDINHQNDKIYEYFCKLHKSILG